MPSLEERYVASMVLSGVGDAMGFRNGRWEFCMSGPQIHDELERMGSFDRITIALPKWRLSDDTIMHIATAEAMANQRKNTEKEPLYQELAAKYKESMNDMRGRSPGPTCMGSARMLKPLRLHGHHIIFNSRGGGCGAAMRAACIGLRYPRPEQIDELIAVGIEAGRMTHHHPTGYLGSLAAGLFTSYAIQGKPVREWGKGLMATLPRALQYVQSQGRYVAENEEAWPYFQKQWTRYLKDRGIEDGTSEPVFPKRYDVKARDDYYSSLSYSGWGGASGHDAPMIAYDALLGAGDSWFELVLRGILHGGDNDSTGAIAGAWFGALYGFHMVPSTHFHHIEYRERMCDLAIHLLKQSHPEEPISEDLNFVRWSPGGDKALAPVTEGASSQDGHQSTSQGQEGQRSQSPDGEAAQSLESQSFQSLSQTLEVDHVIVRDDHSPMMSQTVESDDSQYFEGQSQSQGEDDQSVPESQTIEYDAESLDGESSQSQTVEDDGCQHSQEPSDRVKDKDESSDQNTQL